MTTNATSLALLLKDKKQLDQKIPYGDREAGCAAFLQTVLKSVAPDSKQPRQVITALTTIERLAGLDPHSVSRLWLAVRALDLKTDEVCGGTEIENPVALVFLKAAGAIPSLDPAQTPNAWLGAIDDTILDAMPAGGRVADFHHFTVKTGTGDILFQEPKNGAAPASILDAIDAMSPRHPKVTQNSRAGAAVPIPYNVLANPSFAQADGDALFTDYITSRIDIPSAQKHPTPLMEPVALSSVALPAPNYHPVLDLKLLVTGILSDVQLETIITAGNTHVSRLPTDPRTGLAPRRGFLVGHGTGVGKGRIISGIVLDNWNQGRDRSIWITDSQKLIEDAMRDWRDLGRSESDFIHLIDFSPAERLPHRPGILFATFALLRSEERMAQIIEWFGAMSEAVLVMDESQAGRNAVKNGKDWFDSNATSLQGEAMVTLQEQLPNARVVYSSATAAMDIVGLGYASRLGLWGPGTAFPSPQSFFKAMEEGGIGALELVARDMKALGLYSAANLSMKDVTYRRISYQLTPQERATQDRLSKAWMQINIHLQKAMLSTGIVINQQVTLGSRKLNQEAETLSRRRKNLTEMHFRMAKSRFFQALIASLKTRRLLPEIEADIAAGLAPIIQLTNTYEANLNRAIAASTADDFSDIDATPRDILIGYVKEQFPVWKHHFVRNKDGRLVLEPIYDTNNKPVADAAAVQMRDQLITEIKALDIPECPLEQIIAYFGPDQVAEVTGRSRRLVPGAKAGTRVIQDRTILDVVEDIRAYREDRKTLLVFSTSAGGSGGSYHAARTARNQKRRMHYLVQAGWRADQAIQGLGRSHRSDEVSAPEYILVGCDLEADRRMVSNVASGMESLGAITKGQRHAAASDLFTQDDNLESEMASDAFRRYLQDLKDGKVPGLTVDWFEHETGIPLRKENGYALADHEMPTVRRFLNAMSGMTCDRQEAFGDAFRKRLEEVRLDLIRNGTFDRGVEWIQADSIIKVSDETVWRDPRTGATTRLLYLVKREKVNPMTFDHAKKKAQTYGASVRVVINGNTNRVAVLGFPQVGNRIDDEDEILVITPKGEQIQPRKRLAAERWRTVSPQEAQRIWEIELKQIDTNAETWFHMVTGVLLPIWDKLPKNNAEVWRLQTDEGERILGRQVPEEWANALIARFGSGKIAADEALAALEKGATAQLANGWIAYGFGSFARHYGGQATIELTPVGYDNDREAETWLPDLQLMGVITKSLPQGGFRFTLPADETARATTWAQIAAKWPVMGLTSIATAA